MEVQIKAAMRYNFTSIRMAKIKKMENNKSWRGCGKMGILIHCWWDIKWSSHCAKQLGDSSKS